MVKWNKKSKKYNTLNELEDIIDPEFIKSVVRSCKPMYYSLEIQMNNISGEDLLTFDYVEPDPDLRNSIIEYIKRNWRDENPLNRFYKWLTIFEDMSRLSREFPDQTFILYAKGPELIDDVNIKVFKDGNCTYTSNKVMFDIKLVGPNNSYIPIDYNTGMIKSPNIITTKDFQGDRDLSESVAIAMDVAGSVGEVAVGVAGAVGSGTLALGLVSVAITTIGKINVLVENVKWNKTTFHNMSRRCEIIVEGIQKVRPTDLELASLAWLVEILDQCLAALEKYANRWFITQIISSSQTRKKFTRLNDTLSNCMGDLGVFQGWKQDII